MLRFSDLFQMGIAVHTIYLHCLLAAQMTSPRISGKLFVGCWQLLVLLPTTLVPAELQADWDWLRDHSQGAEKHWEELVAVSLLKQLMPVADL
jgi:hypothetical protein